jgi:hypothetical protein
MSYVSYALSLTGQRIPKLKKKNGMKEEINKIKKSPLYLSTLNFEGNLVRKVYTKKIWTSKVLYFWKGLS